MIPSPISNHVQIALGKLISQYAQNKPVLHGLIRSYVNRLQELEDTIWQVLYLRLLHPAPGQTVAATGAQLDVLGSLVKCPRNGLSDADYVNAIDVQILVNDSQGRPDDFLGILNAVLGGPSAYTYVEEYYNCNIIDAYGLTNAQAVTLLRGLQQARAAGYRVLFSFSQVPLSSLGKWGDISTGSITSGALGAGDISTGTVVGGGLPASTQG